MLTCTKCKESKPMSGEYFPPHNGKKNGFDSWCRKCRANYRSNIRRGNYRKFGISDDDLKILLARGKCDICGCSGPSLSVDHCHSENKVRGLLCMNCNLGLGKFKDDLNLLQKAQAYLSQHRDPNS